MKLTDAWLRAQSGKPYKGKAEITYKHGLGIRISPKGKITWIYRALLKGKPIKMKIGEYPSMKIKEATEERDRLSELVQQGIDPRNKSLITLNNSVPTTVAQTIEHYIENQLKPKNMQWRTIAANLDRSVNTHIGDYPIGKIELSDFVEMFNRERKRLGEKHSARLLQRMKTVMNYAVRNGFLKYNVLAPLRTDDVGEKTKPRKIKLVEMEIGALWTKIFALPYHLSIIHFLALNMIFASRASELRKAKKSDFDWERKLWIVPEENNKIRGRGGSEIVRPIPKLAEKILRNQIAMFPDAVYMFPRYYIYEDIPINAKTPYRPSLVLAEAMEAEGFTSTRNHDMRRTARNAWEMMRFPYHVSESMLGHKIHRGTQAHYLDYVYIDEQRECYERWCDYILDMADMYKRKSKNLLLMGSKRKAVNE